MYFDRRSRRVSVSCCSVMPLTSTTPASGRVMVSLGDTLTSRCCSCSSGTEIWITSPGPSVKSDPKLSLVRFCQSSLEPLPVAGVA